GDLRLRPADRDEGLDASPGAGRADHGPARQHVPRRLDGEEGPGDGGAHPLLTRGAALGPGVGEGLDALEGDARGGRDGAQAHAAGAEGVDVVAYGLGGDEGLPASVGDGAFAADVVLRSGGGAGVAAAAVEFVAGVAVGALSRRIDLVLVRRGQKHLSRLPSRATTRPS